MQRTVGPQQVHMDMAHIRQSPLSVWLWRSPCGGDGFLGCLLRVTAGHEAGRWQSSHWSSRWHLSAPLYAQL